MGGWKKEKAQGPTRNCAGPRADESVPSSGLDYRDSWGGLSLVGIAASAPVDVGLAVKANRDVDVPSTRMREKTSATPRPRSRPTSSSVPPQVMLPGAWRAKSKRGKDAGSAHVVHMGATEDEASRSFAAAQGPGGHCLRGHSYVLVIRVRRARDASARETSPSTMTKPNPSASACGPNR